MLSIFDKYVKQESENDESAESSEQKDIEIIDTDLQKYKIDKQTEKEIVIEKHKIDKQYEYELEKYKIDKGYNKPIPTNKTNNIGIINEIEQINERVASNINTKLSQSEKSSDEDKSISNIEISVKDTVNINKNEGSTNNDLSINVKIVPNTGTKVTKCPCGSFKSIVSDKCKQCERLVLYESLMEGGRHVNTRPSDEQLKKDTEQLPTIWIGKRYGVSDNAVRKWIKRMNKKDQKLTT